MPDLHAEFLQFFSGESKIVKSRPVAGRSAPDALLACVVWIVSLTLGGDIVLAAP